MRKFTLIELLVVVAVIGILVSLLMPSLGKAREKARRAVCLSNLKQFGVAITIYSNNNDGFAPYHQGPLGNHVLTLITSETFNHMLEYGWNEELLKCPSNGAWGGEDSALWASVRSEMAYLVQAKHQRLTRGPGRFNETDISVADLNLSKTDDTSKGVFSDVNRHDTIGGQHKLLSNHGGGVIYGSLSSTYQKIAGSNRLNADSSAKWITNLGMGKDNSKVVPDSSKARYNHWSNIRPYWW